DARGAVRHVVVVIDDEHAQARRRRRRMRECARRCDPGDDACRRRQPHGELAATVAAFAAHGDRAVLHLDEPAHECQADANPPCERASVRSTCVKASKMLARNSAGMPTPESRIRNTTWSPSRAADSEMRPPFG